MANIGVQRQRTLSGAINVNASVLFNESIVNSDTNLSYDTGTGEFTFTSAGQYYVSWFVAVQASLGTKGTSFALVTNDSTPTYYIGNSSVKNGEITGFAVIDATAGLKIKLINYSSGKVVYGSSAQVTASISIVVTNAMGATGPTGATGATGATGTIGAYAGANEVTDNPEISPNEDIPFSNNGPLLGFTHTPGDTSFTVPSTGTYLIIYSVYITAGLDASISITVNGSVNPATTASTLVGAGEISASVILNLTANDTITLRNSSDVPLTLKASPANGAILSVLKLA